MTIAAILKEKGGAVTTVAADKRVAEAVELLARQRIGAVPVADGESVVGMLSERDVIRRLHEEGAGVLDRRVSDLMTAPVQTATPDETVIGALALMTQRRIRHLPVIAEGKLIGLVSIGDLVKYRIDRIEADAAAMRDYIQSA